MRQKADKLEKGKWYWDCLNLCSLLRFSHEEDDEFFYDDCIHVHGAKYVQYSGIYYKFGVNWDRFLPTPEDIEKYNLNETDK